jgi:hypothetical protein
MDVEKEELTRVVPLSIDALLNGAPFRAMTSLSDVLNYIEGVLNR